RWPPGVRVDAGVHEGDEITGAYDPLLAKLIAHAPTRPQALERLREALEQTELLGVRSNLRFLHWLLGHPATRDGAMRTDTIASLQLPDPPQPDDAAWRRAAQALADSGAGPGGAWGGGWRAGAAAAIRVRHGDEDRRVELPSAFGWTADGPVATDQITGTVHVGVEGQSLEFRLSPPPTVEEAVRHAAGHGEGHAVLTAPMPGRIIAVRAAEGASVQAHATVLVLEAMKMEHAVVSPLAGTVTRLAVREGDQVQRGDLLAEVSA
ncbi:MAG TPA: biotin/lipoyl-containing protein, partial [Candidatus Limnocylindria bacterium]